MRTGCFQCLMKHLGNAAVLIEEVADGYPYAHMVLGHLDQAAQEIREYCPDLALAIRAHRIKWWNNHNYKIPFEAIDAYVQAAALGASLPKLTDEVYDGLDRLASGDGWNLMLGDQR